MKSNQEDKKTVLVGVLKDKRDLNMLLAEKWYRIPMAHVPARRFKYLAFYQPVSFGRHGRRILFYASILNFQISKRRDLLPKETGHPKAGNLYLKVRLGKIKKLPHPIKNIVPRRISFGFTTLDNLLKSKNILELFDIADTERIVGDGLKKAKIKAARQHRVLCGSRPYVLDFAIFCKNGKIAVECDNEKAHSGRTRLAQDSLKNADLRRSGWTVMRLREKNIISDLNGCVEKIKGAIRRFGGLRNIFII